MNNPYLNFVEGIEAGGRLAQLSESEVLWSIGAYGRDDQYAGAPGETYAQRDNSDYGDYMHSHDVALF